MLKSIVGATILSMAVAAQARPAAPPADPSPPALIDIKETIHAHPELSHHEEATSATPNPGPPSPRAQSR